MSFSGKVKEELATLIGVARHCRVAELAALVAFGGDRRGLSVRREVTEKTGRLLGLLRIRDPKQAIGEGGKDLLARDCCRRAYLRGAFLAAGTVSDPDRSYQFEILCDSGERAEELLSLLAGWRIEGRITKRKSYHVLYVKESAQIADLLGLMGASVALLSFENTRVVKEVRGSVNRKVNCETANINKTANAAARVIEDIRKIERAGLFPTLPDGLDEIARLRLKYPEATLAELGARMQEPIGKSGVNHRLRKLSKLADELRG